MKFVLFFFFLALPLFASETTTVSSEMAHYDGKVVTLGGNVTIEHPLGKVTAQKATLTRDEEGKCEVDFPWIDLEDNVQADLTKGSLLQCHKVFIDMVHLTSEFSGKPAIYYRDEVGEIIADKACVDYQKIEGNYKPVKITLLGKVQMKNSGKKETVFFQYALADRVEYFPQEAVMILKSEENKRVLFFDPEKEIQLSAKTIRAQRDMDTGKDSVQGFGDVRCIFKQEELDKLKEQFHLS